MKKIRNYITSAFFGCIILIAFGSCVLASGTHDYYKCFEVSGWGNHSISGRDSAEGMPYVKKGDVISLNSNLYLTVNANTSAHTITSESGIRKKTVVGYTTLFSFKEINGETISNNSNSQINRTIRKNDSRVAGEAGNYYMYSKVSGANSAYYFRNVHVFAVN